ncbi:MAG TPA: hypothetical protein VFM81_06325 [Actinomycetota bacterium]|nr:hypothetical protein [Actinomycetota bacterium]
MIIAVVVAILVVAGVIAAFALTNNDDEPTKTSPTGAATAATAATGPTQPTGPTATGSTGATEGTGSAANLGCSGGGPAPDTLPDGEYFGFVKSMNTASQTMAFDLACFYTGDEANQQAAARGDEVPVPNDVYIVNDNTKLRTLSFDPAAELRLIDWNQCCEFASGAQMPSFASAVAAGDFAEFDGFRYSGTLSPYWVTIQYGQVVEIEEQFLP